MGVKETDPLRPSGYEFSHGKYYKANGLWANVGCMGIMFSKASFSIGIQFPRSYE